MVTVRIKQKGKPAILITFTVDSDKFDSLSERSKFFEKLYGRRQIIRKNGKIYEYHREGVLDSMGHIKVDNSVFIIAMEHMKRMMDFFDEWERKVMVQSFPVLLDKRQIKEIEGE